MHKARLLQSVDAKRSLEFLAAMVRYQSYSGTGDESELARFIVENMKALGLAAELQEVETGRFNAIGRLNGTGGGMSLLWNGVIERLEEEGLID